MYIDKIPDDAVQIKGSYDYIDRKGNVYGIETRPNKNQGRPFKKALSEVYGYKYCGINYIDKGKISKRVHRLVAEAFIPNPDNLPIVMHKDNNKKNNTVENLKWGTISENTQQAFDDELIVNKKGFEDDQSIACDCYDTLTNELVGVYGSVSIASKSTGITKGGIIYQLENPTAPLRKKLYFVRHGEKPREHDVICQLNYTDDSEINRFQTVGKAAEQTNISQQTINQQIKLGHKPKWSKENFYFTKLRLS